MKPRPAAADISHGAAQSRWFSALFGAFLGLTLLKFGNPPIMERWVTPPANAYEFVLGSPWPITWAYVILAVIVLAGLGFASKDVDAPLWLLILPLVWVIWECVSAMWTVNSGLSRPTI